MWRAEIERAAMAAARVELPAVSAALWRALADGHVSEAEAEALSALIETRKVPAIRGPGGGPGARGSRPRSDRSLERRRRWAASGRLPPPLAARFTQGEVAVLAVLAVEATRHGRCTLAHAHLAALAGVSISTVKRAIRAARALGIVEVIVRRVSAFRNDTNAVAIVSREWRAWLARSGGGVQAGPGTSTHRSLKPAVERRTAGKEAMRGRPLCQPGSASGPPRVSAR